METRVILSAGPNPFFAAGQPLTCFGPAVNAALLGRSFWDRLGDTAANTIDTVATGFANMYYGITTGVGTGVGSYVGNPNNVGGLINTAGVISGVPGLNVQNQPLPQQPPLPNLFSNPVVLLGIAAVAFIALRK